MTRIRCRPLGADDDDAIRRLFLATIVLGGPLHRPVARQREYAQLSLGWYLGPGRADAAVAVDERGTILGYALVCTDEAAAARWQARAAAHLAVGVAADALRGRLDRPSRAFWRDRALDALALVRTRRDAPAPVHAHFNVTRAARSVTVGRALLAHVDERCAAAGHDRWYGEMNERAGRRAGAVERLGGEIVARVPNRSFSRLAGAPVVRLTAVRALPAQSVSAASALAQR